MFNVERIRADFPVLHRAVHGKPLVYLDTAVTAQKPQSVIDATNAYYSEFCGSVHRAVYALAEKSSALYEGAREKVRKFIHAGSREEVIFVRGTTEGINLVAQTWGRKNIRAGDEIVVSGLEHHSNIVPWQMLCEEVGAVLRVAVLNDVGEIDQACFERLLNEKTRLVALSHVSNALGTINPIKEMIAKAHSVGAKVMIDGAQGVPHLSVDVQDLDCDFYAFSGHKLYGPTGIGVLYGKRELLEAMPPWQGGGDMIASVTFEKTTYAKSPLKFEAGTPNIVGAIGLAAAIDYLGTLDFEQLGAYEHELLVYGTEKLQKINGLRIIGTAKNKASIISFVMKGVHPHDISSILDRQGIAIRAGHLCAQPVMQHFGVNSLARASLAFYNTHAEIDALVVGLQKVCEVMRVG